jgi:hypothetical protein
MSVLSIGPGASNQNTSGDPKPRADALLSLLPWLGEQQYRTVLTEISTAIGQLTRRPRYRLALQAYRPKRFP